MVARLPCCKNLCSGQAMRQGVVHGRNTGSSENLFIPLKSRRNQVPGASISSFPGIMVVYASSLDVTENFEPLLFVPGGLRLRSELRDAHSNCDNRY